MNGTPAHDPVTGEVRDPRPSAGGKSSAGDLIAQGAQLLEIRTRNQLLVAVQRPRDEASFEKRMLSIAAAGGEDLIYRIPFKEHRDGCQDRRRCNCPKTWVEGNGVGMARAAAQSWGNCSIETRIEQEMEDAWLVGATFVDFETNYTKTETKRVSKLVPIKGGRYVKARDKKLDLVYQQGASKVERDVILRSMRRHIMERAFDLAKQASLQERQPINQQIARIVRRFAELNVGPQMIEGLIGCEFTEAGLQKGDFDGAKCCADLRGILTGIRSGETTVEEVFGGEVEPTAASTPASVTPEDLKPMKEAPFEPDPPTQERPESTQNTQPPKSLF